LILQAFVRSWGTTNRGIFISVFLSSLFFAGYHILYLAAEPPAIVLSRIVIAFLLGILFGTLVLKSGSIYLQEAFTWRSSFTGYGT
jgi:membrane protease YdiL (CAAX protease family)